MSYARFGDDSDIYMYGCDDTKGAEIFECCSCGLAPKGESAHFYGYDNAIAHIREHIKTGHKVPDDTIGYLEWERDGGWERRDKEQGGKT